MRTPAIHTRLCIYPKDIQLITGRSDRYGRKLIKDIKAHLGKEDHHFITIKEFCHYTGLPLEDVMSKIH